MFPGKGQNYEPVWWSKDRRAKVRKNIAAVQRLEILWRSLLTRSESCSLHGSLHSRLHIRFSSPVCAGEFDVYRSSATFSAAFLKNFCGGTRDPLFNLISFSNLPVLRLSFRFDGSHSLCSGEERSTQLAAQASSLLVVLLPNKQERSAWLERLPAELEVLASTAWSK